MGIDLDSVRHALTGPVASIRTPFLRGGDIDFDGLRRVVDFNIAAGSRTMLLTFGDSLYSILTDDEVAEVTRTVAEHTARRAMVVAADRSWWTGKTVAFAEYARGVGADMLMVLPPDWGASGTSETIADHYKAVSEELPVMVVTAAFAGRSAGYTLKTLELVRDTVPGVLAIKDDLCGELGRKLALMAQGHWGFLSGGQKQNHLDVWPYGADGYLSTFITFKPATAHRYWASIEEGDGAAAAAVINEIDMPFFEYILGMTGGFDAAIHGVTELFGLNGRWRRSPYHSLTDHEMDQLKSFLNELGIL